MLSNLNLSASAMQAKKASDKYDETIQSHVKSEYDALMKALKAYEGRIQELENDDKFKLLKSEAQEANQKAFSDLRKASCAFETEMSTIMQDDCLSEREKKERMDELMMQLNVEFKKIHKIFPALANMFRLKMIFG